MSAAKEWGGVHEPGGLEWDNISVRIKQRLADGRPCFDARQSHCIAEILELDEEAEFVWLIRKPSPFVQSACFFPAVLQNHPDRYFFRERGAYTDLELIKLSQQFYVNVNMRIWLSLWREIEVGRVTLKKTETLKHRENVNLENPRDMEWAPPILVGLYGEILRCCDRVTAK